MGQTKKRTGGQTAASLNAHPNFGVGGIINQDFGLPLRLRPIDYQITVKSPLVIGTVERFDEIGIARLLLVRAPSNIIDHETNLVSITSAS